MEQTADAHTLIDTEESLLRVSNTSNPQALASAMSHALYDKRRVVLRAVGAGAVNQAIKACAIARGFVAVRGMDIAIVPGFDSVNMPSGEKVSAITLRVVETS